MTIIEVELKLRNRSMSINNFHTNFLVLVKKNKKTIKKNFGTQLKNAAYIYRKLNLMLSTLKYELEYSTVLTSDHVCVVHEP